MANLFYGFIGSEIGFSKFLLEFGAGAAQWSQWHNVDKPGAVGPCNTTYFCDQPFDHWWVNFGIYLHEQYGTNPEDLTESTFHSALQDYIEINGEPPPLP